MPVKPFAEPRRQSALGIFFIFGESLYKAVRGLWVLGAYYFFKQDGSANLVYLTLAGIAILLFILFKSYFSYLKFQFHINYEREEFILNEGILNTSHTAIPFDKIQQVYFKRGLLQRFINVYEVVVDTAGSQQQEIKIKALSQEDAEVLQRALMQRVKKTKEEVSSEIKNKTEDSQAEKPVKWIYKLTTKTLLKLGFTTNYLRGIWVLFIFLASFFQYSEDYFDEDQIHTVYDTIMLRSDLLYWFIFTVVALLIIGIVVTTLEVFLKYYNLKLIRTESNLELEMGLRTQTRVLLKSRRVQILNLITNPIQKRINLFTVELSLANSTATSEKSKITIPGLKPVVVSHIIDFLLKAEGDLEPSQVFEPHILVFFRRIVRMIFIVPIVGVLSYLFPEYISWLNVIFLGLIYLILGSIYHWYIYKSISLGFTEDYLIKRTGFWKQKKQIIPLYKLQAISVKQPFWYKKRGLVTLTFHTASGDTTFPAVSQSIIKYINYSIFKIESSNEAWM